MQRRCIYISMSRRPEDAAVAVMQHCCSSCPATLLLLLPTEILAAYYAAFADHAHVFCDTLDLP
jgi:hypothetical protein